MFLIFDDSSQRPLALSVARPTFSFSIFPFHPSHLPVFFLFLRYTSKTSEYQISSATFPLPLLMYIRLAHLWREGGYYTDFNVLWHRPFPPAR